MDTRNVSYVLNTLGPWSDPLLAGIGGSASSLNMLEPLSSALPIIRNSPGAFLPFAVLGAGSGPSAAAPSGAAQESPQDPSNLRVLPDLSTPEKRATVASEVYDRIRTILNPVAAGKAVGAQIRENQTASFFSEMFLKNGIALLVGFMLLGFGLWILLYPTAKPLIVKAAKDAAA